MSKERDDMMMRIMESECMGYAYLYPCDYGNRKEFFISTTLENIANFLGSHLEDATAVIINDMCDRLIIETAGSYLYRYKDKKTLVAIDEYLESIRKGEKEVGEVLVMTKEEADEFFRMEDQMVTMAECGMM